MELREVNSASLRTAPWHYVFLLIFRLLRVVPSSWLPCSWTYCQPCHMRNLFFCCHSYCGKSPTTNTLNTGTTFFRHWISNSLHTSTFTLVHPCSCQRNAATFFYVEGTVENWYFHIHIWLVLLQYTNEGLFWGWVFSLEGDEKIGTWVKYKFKNEESSLQRICLLDA